MNTQLVDSIAQLIKSLPEEDRSLLRDKLLTDLFIPIPNTQTFPSQNIQPKPPKQEPNLNLAHLSTLSDQQVIAITELQMEPSQDQKLSQLLQTQQERTLTTAEQSELEMLMEIYQAGLLRKAQALNESVKRGLRQPLSA
ncbi:hypothetical protein VB774_02205 [Pseudanabaena galeata UHCC 0370]|uniref:Uncharacterized protein n=1 Tax=Pseudanabaena galeata UHCC 0370 TaxID=3110310 RepID=A0ABU5TEA4_9CYAN|nr:hypothetical protein [Pseudanabaena galeata]MEA5476421.1 hypothetical protein [Pseudanabaena galeata UHCC 0370]